MAGGAVPPRPRPNLRAENSFDSQSNEFSRRFGCQWRSASKNTAIPGGARNPPARFSWALDIVWGGGRSAALFWGRGAPPFGLKGPPQPSEMHRMISIFKVPSPDLPM